MTKSPVLMLVFNRPDYTRKILSVIRQAKVSQLFVVADGPRAGKDGEKEKCQAVRDMFLNEVDWECEVKTLFRDENWGCGRSPADGITWFFNQVEQGIVLEDDCLPAVSFFRFCDEMLDKYKNDENVFAISGTNLLDKHRVDLSYFFSVTGGNWGWASWKRAWAKYDYNIEAWADERSRNEIREFVKSEAIYEHYSKVFDDHYGKPVDDVWDFQWLFARFVNKGLSIIPSYNQIRNIGFGTDSTHVFDPDTPIGKLNIHELYFPLKPLADIIPEKSFDSIVFEKYLKTPTYEPPTIVRRIKNKIKSVLSSLIKS